MSFCSGLDQIEILRKKFWGSLSDPYRGLYWGGGSLLPKPFLFKWLPSDIRILTNPGENQKERMGRGRQQKKRHDNVQYLRLFMSISIAVFACNKTL